MEHDDHPIVVVLFDLILLELNHDPVYQLYHIQNHRVLEDLPGRKQEIITLLTILIL